jgi:hypothetical protein
MISRSAASTTRSLTLIDLHDNIVTVFDAAVTENFFRENSGHADAANVPLKLRPRRCNRQITDKTQQDRELFFRTRSLGEV